MCLRDRLQTDQVLILSSEFGEEKNGWSFGKVLMGPTTVALVTTENNDMHRHHENPPLLMHFVTALNRKFLRGRFLKAGQATHHCSALRLDCTTVNGFTRLAT